MNRLIAITILAIIGLSVAKLATDALRELTQRRNVALEQLKNW